MSESIKHFTELDSWLKARTLTKSIYKLTENDRFAVDFALKRQVQRSSVSAMANIAEGFGRSSNREFVRFLSIAISSLYETQSHLYVALDLAYISDEEFDSREQLSTECIKLCKGLVRYLRKTI